MNLQVRVPSRVLDGFYIGAKGGLAYGLGSGLGVML